MAARAAVGWAFAVLIGLAGVGVGSEEPVAVGQFVSAGFVALESVAAVAQAASLSLDLPGALALRSRFAFAMTFRLD